MLCIFLPLNEVTALDNQTSKPTKSPAKQKPIEITADSVQQESARNIVKARGNVVVTYEEKTVHADRLIVNIVTGAGEAMGHVVITDGGTRLTADRTRFNMKKNTGKMQNAKGVLAKKATPPPPKPEIPLSMPIPMPQKNTLPVAQEYFVKGKDLSMVGKDHYKAKDATMTTCTGALPTWLIQAESADMIMGDRALFTKGVFKVYDVPILYVPVGYLPLDNERKSGFLMPIVGTGSLNGYEMTNAYYWAINEHSDATITADYMQKRGVRPELEYRYTPEKTTKGTFRGSFMEDKLSNQNLYKVDWTHSQVLPGSVALNGKLDLVGNNTIDRSFSSNTVDQTKRNTDSFLSASKGWTNNTLDFVTRYQESTDPVVKDTFALLPQVTYKTQKNLIGSSPFYFSQETSYTGFYNNLTPTAATGDYALVNRFDTHPQISVPLRVAPWLSVTPTLGGRETYYSQGIDSLNNRSTGFSRGLFEAGGTVDGPKLSKIYFAGSSEFSQIKHTIEPRLIYNYIPDINEAENRNRIKVFDAVDLYGAINRTTYYLTQRILQKRYLSEDRFDTREILKFEVSQSYDARATTQALPTSYTAIFPLGLAPQPFSPVRFDLNSRLVDPFMLNTSTTYNTYDNEIKTFNVEMGAKPINNLSFIIERRYTKNSLTFLTGTTSATTFITGTVSYLLPKEGWLFQYSSRFDELNRSFVENDLSLGFNDPCRCWGLSFDFIQRNNFSTGFAQPETKYMFNLNLLGLANVGTGREKLMHRVFQ